MIEYLLRLALLVPLVGGLAWGSLWLWRKAQLGLPGLTGLPARADGLQVIAATTLGAGAKIVVLSWRDREFVVASSRHGISCLAEIERGDA